MRLRSQLSLSAIALSFVTLVGCGFGPPGDDDPPSDAGVGSTADGGGGGSSCNPSCSKDEKCSGGSCVEAGKWESAQKYCVKVVNDLRARKDKSPLDRSAELEECASKAAASDAESGTPHGHFKRTRGCGGVARAENETPGWPLDHYGSVKKIIERSAEQMFAEGPGGGHYENIVGDHSAVGCGIHVTDGDEVWVVQNYN